MGDDDPGYIASYAASKTSVDTADEITPGSADEVKWSKQNYTAKRRKQSVQFESKESDKDLKKQLAQEELRSNYLKGHPWIVDWVELDAHDFWNRYGQEKGGGRHIIEVLTNTSTTADKIVANKEKPDIVGLPANPDPATAGFSRIQRIRIQSPVVMAYLFDAGSFGNEIDRLRIQTFLRPFLYLGLSQPIIRLALEKLEVKWAGAILEYNSTTSEKTEAADVDWDPSCSSHFEEDPAEANPGITITERTALEHLRCYVKFVDEKVMPLFDCFRGTSHKKVHFDDLPLLFTPGELIYWPSIGPITSVPYPFYQPAWRVYHFKHIRQDSHGQSHITDQAKICCYYIDHDGSSYEVMKGKIHVSRFHGEKAITDLPAYPFRFTDSAVTFNNLKIQGNLFRSFVKEHHLYYGGWTIPVELHQRAEDEGEARLASWRFTTAAMRGKRSSPEHVESAVILDFDDAFMRHPTWKVHFRFPKQSTDMPYWDDEQHPLVHWKDNTMKATLYEVNDLIFGTNIATSRLKNEFIAKDVPICSEEGGLQEIVDEDIVLLPRRLVAYALRERKFLVLDILSLRNTVQGEDMFKDLKINPTHQKTVESLVKAHLGRRRMQNENHSLTLNQDFVDGKGGGLFILLHGAPGVGKTATAEAVAQRYNKPLFSITCGTLGLTPRDVEDELKEIFRLAHRWECILLLDEADVFLARRDIHSLKRNALVSVFLRVLDYYSGILFLTTNRVGTIDEAFKSRIHLSLYYERLTKKQMLAIFKVNLRKLRGIETKKEQALLSAEAREPELTIKDDEIMEFAERHWDMTPRHARWNGRQIRNAFQVASSIARYDTGKQSLASKTKTKDEKQRRPTLSSIHFRLVANIINRFDTYFEMATGETDEQAALLEKARDDRVRDKDLDASFPEVAITESKSSRGMKAREESFERPHKSKGVGKGKGRGYDEEEWGAKLVKTKRKPAKSSVFSYEDEGKATPSRRKVSSPQRTPRGSKKPSTKVATRTSEIGLSSRRRAKDDDYDELDDETSDSEGAGSKEESSDEEDEDEENDDDDDDDDNDDNDDNDDEEEDDY
ncbi:putative AAA family ATPase [Rosellinia necatrix]|uniref:Putative AAA family ATPase n=1 Tax=Rosellinia necatrix TaxID=77044 RepID=A0A1W2TPR5_ROSNE|nr:putative AAA family ATPase [Rosellinia necatrix]